MTLPVLRPWRRSSDIRKALGQENVDIVMYDKLGHGFGLGIDTAAEGWLRDAVAFWEEHRKC